MEPLELTIEEVEMMGANTLRHQLTELGLLKNAAKELKERVSDISTNVAAEFLSLGLKKVVCDEWSHSILNGHSSSLNKEKLQVALLEAGMVPDDIIVVIEKATVTTTYTTIVSKQAKPYEKRG